MVKHSFLIFLFLLVMSFIVFIGWHVFWVYKVIVITIIIFLSPVYGVFNYMCHCSLCYVNTRSTYDPTISSISFPQVDYITCI